MGLFCWRMCNVVASVRGLATMARPWNLGFSTTPGLLVFASVPQPRCWRSLSIYLICVMCAHTYGYLLNDVCDAQVDRWDRRRRHRPLTSGMISRSLAVAVACGCGICALGLLYSVSSHRGGEALVFSCTIVFSTLYNLFSKRTSCPLLTDTVLGLAFATMPILASELAVHTITYLSIACSTYQLTFMLFVNAAYGSVRDLAHEDRLGIQTTARFLGATANEGELFLSFRLLRYCVILLITMIATLIWMRHAISDIDHTFHASVGVLAVTDTAFLLASCGLFWRAWVHHKEQLEVSYIYSTLQMILLFLGPIQAALGRLPTLRLFGLVLATVIPLCFHKWFWRVLRCSILSSRVLLTFTEIKGEYESRSLRS